MAQNDGARAGGLVGRCITRAVVDDQHVGVRQHSKHIPDYPSDGALFVEGGDDDDDSGGSGVKRHGLTLSNAIAPD